MDYLNGKVVLVRDQRAGVFVGTLKSLDLTAKTCVLTDARKVHYWVKAAAVEGLATRGCHRDSRITPMVPMVATCDVIEVVQASEEGAKLLLEAPEWRP